MAYATLIALTASVAEVSGAPKAFRVNPHGDIVDIREAILRLAALPKPLSCEATREGEVVDIQCRGLVSTEDQAVHTLQVSMFAPAVRAEIRGNAKRRGLEPLAIMVGELGEVIFTADEMERWDHTYVVKGAMSLAPAPSEYQRRGVATIVRFSPVSQAEMRIERSS